MSGRLSKDSHVNEPQDLSRQVESSRLMPASIQASLKAGACHRESNTSFRCAGNSGGPLLNSDGEAVSD